MKRTLLAIVVTLLCVSGVWAKQKPAQQSYNLQRGIEAYQNNDYAEARKFLSAELEANPKSGDAYMWYACCNRSEQQLGDALDNITLALKHMPQKGQYYPWCLGFRASLYIQLGDTVAALKDLEQGLKLKHTTPESKFDFLAERAQLYYQMKEYDLSDADFEAMIKIREGYANSYVGLGRNQYAREHYSEAKTLFTQAIRLYEENGNAYFWRAKTDLKLEEYADAVSDVIKSSELNQTIEAVDLMQDITDEEVVAMLVAKLKVQIAKEENTAMWAHFLGYYLDQQQRYEEAFAYYQHANTMEKNDVCLSAMAACCYELGNQTDALRYIDLALQEDSVYWRYLVQKQSVLREMYRNDEARAIADKLVSDYPDASYVYYNRMSLNFDQRNWQAVLEDAVTAIALESAEPRLYLLRGRAYQELGNTEKARRDFEQIIKLDTIADNHSCAHYAYCYLEQPEKARQWMDSILLKRQNEHGTLYDAACLYSLLNDTAAALDYLQQALANGYVHFAHLHADSDLDNLRELPRFQSLVAEYEAKLAARYPAVSEQETTVQGRVVEVPFTKEGGVTKVDCTINNLPLNFVFDTGASDVTISQVEANFMFKNGYLTDKDVVGKARYITADGNVSVGTVINLRQINFGGLELTNVRASVSKSQRAPLLLGQSVLQRLGKIEIDNERRVLKITTNN